MCLCLEWAGKSTQFRKHFCNGKCDYSIPWHFSFLTARGKKKHVMDICVTQLFLSYFLCFCWKLSKDYWNCHEHTSKLKTRLRNPSGEFIPALLPVILDRPAKGVEDYAPLSRQRHRMCLCLPSAQRPLYTISFLRRQTPTHCSPSRPREGEHQSPTAVSHTSGRVTVASLTLCVCASTAHVLY